MCSSIKYHKVVCNFVLQLYMKTNLLARDIPRGVIILSYRRTYDINIYFDESGKSTEKLHLTTPSPTPIHVHIDPNVSILATNSKTPGLYLSAWNFPNSAPFPQMKLATNAPHCLHLDTMGC